MYNESEHPRNKNGEWTNKFDSSEALYEAASSKNHFKLDGQSTFYHASNTPRNGRLKMSTAPQFGQGIYFSTNKDLVMEQFGDHLTKVKLEITNPVFTNTKEFNKVENNAVKNAINDYNKKHGLTEDDLKFKTDWDIAEIPPKYISDSAKELGYDAIIDKGSTQYENEIVVLDEKKINYL